MATKQIVDNFSNTIVNTIQTATLVSTKNLVIEAFTAVNNSSIDASYKAYIVSVSGVEKPLRPFKVVTWGELDLGNGIVNQVIPAGGVLRVESSAIDSIYFTVSAREVSV
ncbi:MAG: hypothetical protein ACI9N9_000303 [Enterobacterales bacterium]|jgi:hypothetical protein